ncbi:unnamed protein product [Nesidiocoris tenuis]|uniref:Uncharacterized protein n=1 Tax=Nesidiocoris tenuis TaxID=355587 RepID=A0A6H5GQ81_9HEMI|nr:unnamed protein product [Nesidiocoris tenuis]
MKRVLVIGEIVDSALAVIPCNPNTAGAKEYAKESSLIKKLTLYPRLQPCAYTRSNVFRNYSFSLGSAVSLARRPILSCIRIVLTGIRKSSFKPPRLFSLLSQREQQLNSKLWNRIEILHQVVVRFFETVRAGVVTNGYYHELCRSKINLSLATTSSIFHPSSQRLPLRVTHDARERRAFLSRASSSSKYLLVSTCMWNRHSSCVRNRNINRTTQRPRCR